MGELRLVESLYGAEHIARGERSLCGKLLTGNWTEQGVFDPGDYDTRRLCNRCRQNLAADVERHLQEAT